ncbi:MAG TPA: hypothetical protein VEX57_00740 [Microlunatus sp.]|nr:hypothetical protein [Microlunatus sp.]
MRLVYKVLAFTVAGLVVVQAAAVAFAVFGLFAYIEGGGTIDAANSGPESDIDFPGVVGFMIHGMFGTLVIPVVALLLLVSSFFAKTAGAVKWALIVFVTTAVQVALGIFAHGIPQLGILHGIVALVLFGAAIMAGMRARSSVVATDRATDQVTAPATRA